MHISSSDTHQLHCKQIAKKWVNCILSSNFSFSYNCSSTHFMLTYIIFCNADFIKFSILLLIMYQYCAYLYPKLKQKNSNKMVMENKQDYCI